VCTRGETMNDEQTRREADTSTAPSWTVISPTTRPSSRSGSSVLGMMEMSVHSILEAISGSNPRMPLALLSLAMALTRSTSDCLSAWGAFPPMVEASIHSRVSIWTWGGPRLLRVRHVKCTSPRVGACHTSVSSNHRGESSLQVR
jgi:hypothetical protein